MTRDRAARAADVWRLIFAARAVVRDRAAIEAEVARETGLSPQGVELAFTRHVETDPSDADVDALVASAGHAPHVAVVLSANVFVASLRAIALARAAAPLVVVRPSRRAEAFVRALVTAARDPGIRLTLDVELAALPPGSEVHVYGRDETIATVRSAVASTFTSRATAPSSTRRVVGHGSGMGIALVSDAADLGRAAEALAADVVAFDQRGCLSPRIALVEGDPGRAAAFGRALDQALDAAAEAIPRGALDASEREDAKRYETTMAFAGHVYSAPDHAVGVAREGAPLVLPPTGRHVHVAPVRDAGVARALLAPLSRFVVCVGADDLRLTAEMAPRHARRALLGEMQRPPLDGPVDRRPT